MAARYRVGIIACGIIAQAHLRAYRKIPAVEVVAGADLSAEVRERWSAEHGIPHMYASPEEMLERERPDVVSICTWPPLRPELTELACAHGVQGILAEKPMAVDLAGCDRMLAAAERSGTVLIVGHQRRFHNRYLKARELIDSGAIGDVVQITGFEGADLLSNGSHTVDIIRHLLHDSPAEWVIGQIDLRAVDRKNGRLGFQQWEETHTRYGHHIESGVFAVVQFQGGARATIEGGVAGRPRRPGGGGWRAIIYGSEGMIEVAGDQLAEGEAWVRARVKGEADWIEPEVEGNDAFRAEIEALIAVLEHGGTHPLNGRSARAGHEIMMAIYESARRRARIELPLAVVENPLEMMVAAGEVQGGDQSRGSPAPSATRSGRAGQRGDSPRITP
ncbi:MAG: Gfo/Idh/MocA family protein [Chloroflexota bacterium]